MIEKSKGVAPPDEKKKCKLLKMPDMLAKYEKLSEKDKKQLELNLDSHKKQTDLVGILKIRARLRAWNSSLSESDQEQCTFANLKTHKDNEKQITQLKKWHYKTTKKNIILSGSVGTGKTWACKAIINKVYSEDFPCKLITFSRLLDCIKMSYDSDQTAGDAIEARSEYRQVLECKLLVLDDLGAEKGQTESNSWAYEQLYSIINDRVEGDNYLFITTNLKGIELRDRYGCRVLDRLTGSSRSFAFEGRSFRQLNNDNDSW